MPNHPTEPSLSSVYPHRHIDCDIYSSTRDALSMLADRLAPGALLLFDELVNYPGWREHEAKALWEFLGATGQRVAVVGVKGPLGGRGPMRNEAVDPEPEKDVHWSQQSAAFVLLPREVVATA